MGRWSTLPPWKEVPKEVSKHEARSGGVIWEKQVSGPGRLPAWQVKKMIQGSIAFLHPVIACEAGWCEWTLKHLPGGSAFRGSKHRTSSNIWEKIVFHPCFHWTWSIYETWSSTTLLWWSGSRLENGDVEIFRKKGLSMGKHVRSPKHSKVDNFWITLPPKRLCSNRKPKGLLKSQGIPVKLYRRDCCQLISQVIYCNWKIICSFWNWRWLVCTENHQPISGHQTFTALTHSLPDLLYSRTQERLPRRRGPLHSTYRGEISPWFSAIQKGAPKLHL